MDRVFDVEEGIPLNSPLSYFYGHPNPSQNLKHYKILLKKLGKTVLERLAGHSPLNSSGIIATFCAWNDAYCHELLSVVIESFQCMSCYLILIVISLSLVVDTIVVLGDERLSSELNKKWGTK